MSLRIVLIHAVPMAIEPIKYAFNELWPEPEVVNLFDDSLSVDRAKSNVLTTDMEKRFSDLGNYAESIGADGILFTCSAFGPAIDKVAYKLTIPVLKPNEAMFEQALNTGHKIGMLATFEQSIASMSRVLQIRNSLSATGSLDTKLAKGAMEFLTRQPNKTQ